MRGAEAIPSVPSARMRALLRLSYRAVIQGLEGTRAGISNCFALRMPTRTAPRNRSGGPPPSRTSCPRSVVLTALH